MRVLPTFEKILRGVFHAASEQVPTEFLTGQLWANLRWRDRYRNSNEKTNVGRVRRMLRNPIYAGYMHVPNQNEWSLVEALGERVISFEIFSKIQVSNPSRAQRRRLSENKSDFWLSGRITCGECGRKLVPSAVYFEDVNTGEILCDYQKYVCPPRTGCGKRKILDAAELHQQFSDVLATVAGKRGRPDDLVEQWRILPRHERAAFVKTCLSRQFASSTANCNRRNGSSASPNVI